MIKVTATIFVPDAEIGLTFIRAPGPGGQNVNKVATAVLLRFNVRQSPSLPEAVRTRLLVMMGKRITQTGELIIKASRFRTQERNKQDALNRLQEFIRLAAITPKKRKKTKPTFASTERRLNKKKQHAKNKSLRRGALNHDD